ncbi:carbohydrate ABC transporter permease [Kitasatospora sp. NPDC057015]|uniref:carbohydrate ABC transporter permease n=1 Tax=Kitasatospora sp. NPDC057015 TaxID=3346001 RepID=UPI00363E7457
MSAPRTTVGPAGPPAPPTRQSPAHTRAAFGFLLPFGLLFAALFLLPIGYTLGQSLYRVERSGLGFGPSRTVFAGAANYAAALKDGSFLAGVARILLLGIVQVPVMLGLALVLALLVDTRSTRLRGFFRLACFLPYAIPGVVATLLWAFLYLPGTSPLVAGLTSMGIRVDLLSAGTVLWSTANIVTWTWTGYNMLVILAALRAVPGELYEAAELDGAGSWRIAWHIKIPLVVPALVLTGTFSIIGTLQLFTEPVILRSLTSTVSADYTPNMAAYQAAFGANDYGRASAIAVLLALATCLLSFSFLRLSARLTGSRVGR